MQRGGGVVDFVHIDESATPGCKCLTTLLKGRLPVHVCHVFYVVVLSLLSMEISSVYRVLKYYSNVEYPSHRPHAKFNFCVRLVTFF
jgi:hypothetical protein